MLSFSRISCTLLLLFASGSAFMVSTDSRRVPVASPLQQSSVPQDSPTATTTTRRDHPAAWFDQPARKSSSETADRLLQVADSTEILLGRAAMIGAVVFLATEVVTGESIPAQFISLMSSGMHT